MSRKTDLVKGLGCLTLFALPFMAVGTFASYRIATALWDWSAMRGWEETAADIVHVDLVYHDGSDSRTYEVKAQYRYRYGGRDYTGHRVSVLESRDNVGDFHHTVNGELSEYWRTKTPFRCFVNPKEPSEAVLYRDLRWGLMGLYGIFALLFGGVGFGLVGAGVRGARKSRELERLKSLHPEEPWLHKEEWREGRVRSSTKPLMVGSILMAVFWNAISAPLLFIVPREWEKGNTAALLGLLFPLVGLGLIFWAGTCIARWRKFGESVLELSSFPGVVGGALSGNIHTSVNLRAEGGFRLTLSCVRIRRRRRGRRRSTSEKILWQKTQIIEPDLAAPDPRRSSIPVSFHIPFDVEPTDEDDPDNRVVWRLEVKAAVSGVDYDTRFEVPVFKTAESSPDYVHDDSELRPLRPQVDLDRKLRKAGIGTQLLPSGKRYFFPMARNPWTALFTTAFFAAWTGVVVALHHYEAPRLFTYVFALFDLLFVFAVLDLWFYKSHIEVRPGELSFSGGLFGLGAARTLAVPEIGNIRPKRGMQSGNKLFYQLQVRGRNGRDYIAAKRLPDLETTEELVKEIEAVLAR